MQNMRAGLSKVCYYSCLEFAMMMESSLTIPYHRIAFPLLAFYDFTRARRPPRQVIKTLMVPRNLMYFCYYIGWGAPFLLYLFLNYYQTWHDSTMAQNLSKAAEVKSIITPLRRHICSVEYQKLLKTVYIEKVLVLHLLSNLIQTWQKH